MTQNNSISVQESCCIQQHEIRSFFEKSSFFSSQHSPSKKLGAESHGCKLSETKFKALNRLKKKSKLHVVPVQKQKKTVFSIRTKIYSGNKKLFGGESNPGLQRDRLGFSPLYYRRYAYAHIFQVHVIRTSQIIERHNRTRSAFRNPAVYSNLKSQHFLLKNCFFASQHSSSKKCSAKNYTCKILEKNQALNLLKKSNFHVVPFQKQKNAFSIRTKKYSGNKNLFCGESNPGLQHDRLGYSPRYN